MRCVSQSAERQQDMELCIREGVAQIRMRTNHRAVEDEDGAHWECDEAYMECPAEECPEETEIEEEFEAWFDYAADWQPNRQKSLGQLQADIEYIAAMTGVDLEG